METTNNTTMEISLKEVLAVILRGGKKIILIAVAFAILFGAVSALNQHTSSAASEQAYSTQIKEYEKAKEELDLEIEKLRKDLENQKQYNENSQLMQIDPYNKITTTVVFAISGVKLEQVTEPFKVTETPISYVLSLIQAQYLGVWNGLDLSEITAGTRYEGINDKYLREVIKLEGKDGGVMELTVEGSSAEECAQIAKGLYAQLLKSSEKVVKASYEHTFAMLNDTITKTSIDTDLEKRQLENREKQDKYQVTLEEKEKELEALVEPAYEGGVTGVVTNAILGGLSGAFATMIILVVFHFLKGRVSGSKQLSNRYGLIHFGSLIKNNDLLKKLAYSVMSEKLWTDAQQAKLYIAENCAYHLNEGAAVVVATTLDRVEEDVKKQVTELLGAKGRTVSFVTDATHNPEALKAIVQADSIILAERAFVSQNASIKDLLKKTKELNETVCGFILL